MARWVRAVSVLAVILLTGVVSPFGPPAVPASADSASWEAKCSGGDTSNGITVFNTGAGSDGATSCEAIDGNSGYRVSTDGYLYFKRTGTLSGKFAKIEIQYYDPDLSSVTDKLTEKFYLQYKNSSGALTSSLFVYATGATNWVTATLYLSDANLGSDLFGSGASATFMRVVYQNDAPYYGKSQRLAIRKVNITTSSSSLLPTSFGSASWEVGSAGDTINGLLLVNAGDGVTSRESNVGGKAAYRVSSSGYLYLRADTPAPAAETYAAIDVEFYDSDLSSLTASQKITEKFTIQYPSTSGLKTASPPVYASGAGAWRTATFYLADVDFSSLTGTSGLPAYADFRVLYGSDAPFYGDAAKRLAIHKVTLTLSTSSLQQARFANVSSTSWSPTGSSGLDQALGLTDGYGAGVTVGGRSAYQLSSAGYAYFNADDSYLSPSAGAGSTYDSAEVTVSFYDQGYGRFYITYDSTQDNTAIAANSRSAPTLDQDLQSNGVAYLMNSGSWITYTFLLNNLRFENGENAAVAPWDFRVVYAADATANQGYTLAIDGVTLTRKTAASHVDRKSMIQGNNARPDVPTVVWTRLANKNVGGHGLHQFDPGDGATTADGSGANQGRKATSGYIYFDANDNYIYNGNAKYVYVSVEYLDNGAGSFTIQYDSTSGSVNKQHSDLVTPGSSGKFIPYTFVIDDAKFANGLNGADFRIVNTTKDLVVRNVRVARATGDYVLPRSSSLSYPQGVDTSTRQVATFYFPAFDGYYPSLWEASTMGPPGGDATTHVLTSYSLRSVDTLKQDLTDMQYAGVDIVLPWFQGSTTDQTFQGRLAIQNLVRAHDALASTVKIGLFLDPVHMYHEGMLKPADTQISGSDANALGLLYKLAEDFFSLVPPSKVATFNGRPVIVVYAPDELLKSGTAGSIDWAAFRQRFKGSFGVEPYIVAAMQWNSTKASDGEYVANLDEWFGWSASLVPAGYTADWMNTYEIGPGFDDSRVQQKNGKTGRTRSRDNGEVYKYAWNDAVNRGHHLALLETWNYWVEGSGVTRSDLYGTQYLDLTKDFTAKFKAATYGSTRTATADLGKGEYKGLAPMGKLNYAEGMTNATFSTGTKGDRSAARLDGDNLFFAVDDSFALDAASGAGAFTIEITYWDGDSSMGGGDALVLMWDGQSSKTSPATNSLDTNTIDIKNGKKTGTWQTKSFTISDAKFGNRQTGRADFYFGNAKGVWIQKVSLTKPQSLVKGLTADQKVLTFRSLITDGKAQTPAPVTVTLSNMSGASVAWTASESVAWLSLNKTSGSSLPDTLVASADPSGQYAGYIGQGSITITAANGDTLDLTATMAVGNFTRTVSLPVTMVQFSSSGW